jgi:hypothetical protein
MDEDRSHARRVPVRDRWFVPGAAPEEVYDVLGDQLSYPVWWGDVFLEVEGDGGAPRPGGAVVELFERRRADSASEQPVSARP